MPVTLAQLLERGTPVAWFESVAIVQELCAALIDRGGEQASVPELREIAITEDGHIELLADGPTGQPPVHRAGRVLTALVDQQQMPVPLRLLALTAVSPEPTYASLRELSTALEYFERPDRARVVAAVYERIQQMPAPESGAAVPALPVLEEPAPPPKRPAGPAWWRRRSALAAGAAVLLVLAGVGAWWLSPEGSWVRSGTRQVSGAVTAAADKVASVATSGIQAVKERFGDGAASAPPPETPADTASAITRSPAGRPGPLPSSPVFTVKRKQGLAVLPTLYPPYDPWKVPALLAPDPFLVVATPVEESGVLYTDADPAVMPPELIRPRLPKSAPPGVRLEDLPQIEVVVSATGEVESAKLISPGSGVYPYPAMMVSAVKNWRFQPATKAGQPVRYRHRLWLRR